ncbi:hypothetical protein SAY86_016489 [Trapa natans]|uniref:Aldehyde oxidase GLOX n=1 Tax=Trapa natans TaxID=22666 RepID=A0AAN7QX80_TRANT|nr:hypothetical protein SAY86_016489 [Trapa natans]
MAGTAVMILILLGHTLYLFSTSNVAAGGGGGGSWRRLQESIGISAMHMQLLHNDRVVIFDRTDFGRSNLSLPNGRCRDDPRDTALHVDCTAHSVEYDVAANSFRPLTIRTDTWCSSGSVMPDGQLVQTGGYNDGIRCVRIFKPCRSDCDWEEVDGGLSVRRWYSTNHLLPDGRQIIVGGRRQFTYEFYPKAAAAAAASGTYSLPFLAETSDPKVENNLYPFVHLNIDGNLFIFANNRAILFDYIKNKVVKTYPEIPGGDPRSYPSTGSSALLPLRVEPEADDLAIEVEVLVCGGAPKGSYAKAMVGDFVEALNTCGRIKINDPDPKWAIETMPEPRVMSDMLLLPNGDVLIINGCSEGTAGWENGRRPALRPVIYRPGRPAGGRFDVQSPNGTPRMYHSSAILLRDGRVLVGGSNPHIYYNFTGVLFPTELSLDAFSPEYLDGQFAAERPKIRLPSSQTEVTHGERLTVEFEVAGTLDKGDVAVTMLGPPFATHSFSMNQRLLVIGGSGSGSGKLEVAGPATYKVEVVVPRTANLAPPGFYLLFVVYREIPSEGIWVNIR